MTEPQSGILPRLTPEEETLLLDLARRAVIARLESRLPPRLEEPSARLLLPQGAFVSLRRGRRLRGCVGMMPPARALASIVAECAAAAATSDPRFEPLRSTELTDVTIEISALDPPFRVADPSQITLGTHGVIVSEGERRALLLPQVASEQRWDVATLLEETCLKAGLRRDAWAQGAVVEAFSAQVFSEREPPRH